MKLGRINHIGVAMPCSFAVIARIEVTKQSSEAPPILDCFAALAMTSLGRQA